MDGVDFLKNLPKDRASSGRARHPHQRGRDAEPDRRSHPTALQHIPAEKITLSSDCGMKPLSRMVAS
jgi:hypothetical protein